MAIINIEILTPTVYRPQTSIYRPFRPFDRWPKQNIDISEHFNNWSFFFFKWSIAFCLTSYLRFICSSNFKQMNNIEIEKPMIIESATTAVVQKKYSLSMRLWHWSNSLIITGSLLTVLINSTVLKPWTNAGLIADKLKEKGVNVSDEQTRSVAFALSDKVWAIHTYFGYALAALFIFRLVIELSGLADKTLIRTINSAKRSFMSVKEARITSLNEKLVKATYTLFYVLLAVMVLTGLGLSSETFIPAIRSLHFIRDIHEFTMYPILGFIIIHLVGVFSGERKGHRGIISDMVNGGTSE